jgi:hypothetical protein
MTTKEKVQLASAYPGGEVLVKIDGATVRIRCVEVRCDRRKRLAFQITAPARATVGPTPPRAYVTKPLFV